MVERAPNADLDAVNIEQDICFAVVMYGGVSLAIYIHGVSQELFNLVQATALDPDGKQLRVKTEALSDLQRVYRKAARLVGQAEGDQDGERGPVRARFVVDVLSGTSAGGINAVYLAKALANGQSLSQLRDLWLDEADFGRLLNDNAGPLVPRAPAQREPSALFNSGHMYKTLFDALEQMDNQGDGGSSSLPYCEQLDLSITCTDFHGKRISLRLADQPVRERRHRTAFQFRRYGDEDATGQDDFGRDKNRLLALAARCTSSFPVAFDPVSLDDVAEIMGLSLTDKEKLIAQSSSHLSGYATLADGDGDEDPDPDPDRTPLERRYFVDGGYLDNKPFGWALDAIAHRKADRKVDRKLLYIEPDPEDRDTPASPPPRPNALENVLAAATLARHETIREDLQAINERNRTVERVLGVIEYAEADAKDGATKGAKIVNYSSLGLEDMLKVYGAHYGAYHRLKVSTLTEELTIYLAVAAGLNPDTHDLRAFQDLVRNWRKTTYALYKADRGTGKNTENMLLRKFDLGYRIRRLAYVIRRLDKEAASPGRDDEQRADLQTLRKVLQPELNSLRSLRRRLKSLGPDNPFKQPHASRKIIPKARWVRDGAEAELAAWMDEELHRVIEAQTRIAAQVCEQALPEPQGAPTAKDDPIEKLSRCYYEYERYDQLMLPVQQAAGLDGELDPIEVFRVSPRERRFHREKELAGTGFAHFAAFFDRSWRWNDMVTGRLDGAGRLLTAILPDHAKLPELIEEAHAAIMEEESRKTWEEVWTKLSREPEAGAEPDTEDEATQQKQLLDSLEQELEVASPTKLAEFWTKQPTKLAASTTIPLAGRSARVMGELMNGLTSDKTPGKVKSAARWAARLGQIAATLVEFATPGKPASALWARLLGRLYLAEGVLFVGGLLFGHSGVMTVALKLLGVTFGTMLAVWMLADLMRAKPRRAVSVVGVVALFAFAAVGLWELSGRVGDLLARIVDLIGPWFTEHRGP